MTGLHFAAPEVFHRSVVKEKDSNNDGQVKEGKCPEKKGGCHGCLPETN